MHGRCFLGGVSHFNLFDNEFNGNTNSISIPFKLVAVSHPHSIWIDRSILAVDHDLGCALLKAID